MNYNLPSQQVSEAGESSPSSYSKNWRAAKKPKARLDMQFDPALLDMSGSQAAPHSAAIPSATTIAEAPVKSPSFNLAEAEELRLRALKQFCILDTDPEPAFDSMTALAASIFNVPIAVISMVDHRRQWHKSKCGIDVNEVPLEMSFCAHAVRQNSILYIPNTRVDPRFSHNPMVLGSAGLVFYAGAPLVTKEGFRIGTLCIADRKLREDFSERDLKILGALANQVLDQLELRRARLAAERSLRDKSSFVAAISHEIRTPMSGIIGTAQLLQQGIENPNQLRYIDTLLGCASQMQRLLDDILDISKLEAGHMELVVAKFSLSNLLKPVIDLFQNTATSKGISLAASSHWKRPAPESYATINPDQIMLFSDAQRLRQVLINLVNNALKFTEKGGISITVEVTMNEAASDQPNTDAVRLHFSIKDSGCGIPSEVIEKLGQDYFQVSETESRRVGGTGLGLAISKRILERLGGNLSIESELGIGSEFSFTLTLPFGGIAEENRAITQSSMGDNSGDDSRVAKPLANDKLAAPSRSLDILCVDDDHAGLMITSELLRRAGHRIVPAATALEAIERVVERRFDAILLDMHLPDLDGPGLAQAIRSLETAEYRTPIIAVTASAFASDRQRCLDADMDEHIAKPVDMRFLLSTLTRLAMRKTTAAERVLLAAESLRSSTLDGRMSTPQTIELSHARNAPVVTIDLSQLHQIREMIPEEKGTEIISLFSQSCVELIELCSHYQSLEFGSSDWVNQQTPALVNRSHIMVGTAGSLGLNELCEAARAIDQDWYSDQKIGAQRVSDLKTIASQTLDAVTKEFKLAA